MAEVSVIIPTYAEPVFLKQAIQSVLNQTFSDIELIVVDDNASDTEASRNTEKLISEYGTRLRYIKHKEHKNGAAARNTGFAASNGKYIAFLDSDDEYLPERIERCISELKKNPDAAGVYTGCEFRRGGKTYKTFTDVKSGRFLTETLASTFMFCTGSNIFVHREVIDSLGGFDENFLRHQDFEFLVRLFEKYELSAIPEVLVIKNNENFNLPDPDVMRDVKRQYLEKYKNIIKSLPQKERDYIYSMQYIMTAEGYMRCARFDEADIYYKKAKETGPIPFKYAIRRVGFRMGIWN